MYVCMCTITIYEKRDHEFKREQGELCGRVWRKEWEGGKVIITLESKKIKTNKLGLINA